MNLRYFEAIAEATDKVALFSALNDLSSELDFGRFTLLWFQQGSPSATVIAGAYVHNTPEEFLEHASSPEMAAIDPVFQHITSSPRPIAYDQTTYTAAGAGDLWDVQAPFGYKTGIAIGMNINGRRAVFGIDRDSKLPKDSDRLAYLVSQLTMGLAYSQDTAEIVLGSSPLGGLSLQRLHILRLIAEGKSDSVIAQILGVTKHTVNFHVRKIFAALGVSSRAQAIIKGAAYLKGPA